MLLMEQFEELEETSISTRDEQDEDAWMVAEGVDESVAVATALMIDMRSLSEDECGGAEDCGGC